MLVLDCPIGKQDWVHGLDQRNGAALADGKDSAEKPVEGAGPWEPTVQKIVEFQGLADNWDGFGAEAPSHELLESAIGLAYCLYEKGLEPPHRVAPGVCGSVILEWQDSDGTYAEVEIDRPLHAEVMVVEPGKPAKQWTLPSE
jgi:hypothetical protein